MLSDYTIPALASIIPTYTSLMEEGRPILAYAIWLPWYIVLWMPLSAFTIFFFTMDITLSVKIMVSIYFWPYAFLGATFILLQFYSQVNFVMERWNQQEVTENFSNDLVLSEKVTGIG